MKSSLRVLRQAVALSAAGDTKSALSLLESGLLQATKDKNHAFAVHFASNAGLICDHMGDLRTAERYYRIALQHGKSRVANYYSLADLYERMGKKALSRRYFKNCREIALKNSDENFLEILEKRNKEKRGK